jgi:dihydropteroate synthase-like protein
MRSSVESIHFVTGKLAESAVREYVEKLSQDIGFHYTIEVLPITVAALMTPKWLLRHVHIPDGTTSMIVPGYLEEGLVEIQAAIPCRVECGPKDIRNLPLHFGKQPTCGKDYGEYSIEILAEINIAPRWPIESLVQLAKRLVEDGANCIDLGCQPGHRWSDVAECVHRLRDQGIRCSIDTFDPWEAAEAVRAGAELVLSVNSSNRNASVDWGAEVVVVPDTTEEQHYLASLEDTAMFLDKHRIPFRVDPILEPIGCGFAASLNRYRAVRTHFPDVPMMMGIGNLTELTDCDSAGINLLLLAICEEWAIHSVLTTQVISWAQSSVRECELARRLVGYAVRNGIPPKRLDSSLVMLRDPRVNYFSESTIVQLANSIKDNNYRIMIDGTKIHLIAARVHLQGTDPFAIMEELMKLPQSSNVDSNHAFYLGFELSKAATALTLGKQYEQDMALQWGMLTRPEKHHRLARRHRRKS